MSANPAEGRDPVLGVTLRYPNYRDGLRPLHAAGNHLAVAEPATPA